MNMANERVKELIFLGSGGPFALPQFFCQCVVCNEARQEPSQRRTRASAAIVGEEVTLVDAGPDLEIQLEREGIANISNIIITHWHYDHIAGLGAIGHPQVMCGWDPIDIYVPENLMDHFDNELAFLKKRIKLHPIRPGATIKFPDFDCQVVKTSHTENSIGIIANSKIRVAYLVDTSMPPDDTCKKIRGADVLVLDATFDSIDTEWRHFAIQDAINFWKSTSIPHCILTHLSCHRWENSRWIAGLSHTQRVALEKQNPGLQFAYDGLRVQI